MIPGCVTPMHHLTIVVSSVAPGPGGRGPLGSCRDLGKGWDLSYVCRQPGHGLAEDARLSRLQSRPRLLCCLENLADRARRVRSSSPPSPLKHPKRAGRATCCADVNKGSATNGTAGGTSSVRATGVARSLARAAQSRATRLLDADLTRVECAPVEPRARHARPADAECVCNR
jgi:hypothetical protein